MCLKFWLVLVFISVDTTPEPDEEEKFTDHSIPSNSKPETTTVKSRGKTSMLLPMMTE